jgi:hypothetical protein
VETGLTQKNALIRNLACFPIEPDWKALQAQAHPSLAWVTPTFIIPLNGDRRAALRFFLNAAAAGRE